MKIKLLLLFVSSAVQGVYAQTVIFKEIKLKPKPEFYNTANTTIIYPVVITNNKAVDKLINDEIKAGIFFSNYEKVSSAQMLKTEISGGLINMGYEVTYKKNDILSLYITSEGCGAYCSTYNTYFNFDLKTGKALSIGDLIPGYMIDTLKKIVFADKLKALDKYKEEKKAFANGEDSAAVNWAIQEVNDNCIVNAEIEKFTLSALSLEIIDPCIFPHAIRSLEPDYALKYSYKFMLPFLKPKFRTLFLK